MSEGTDSTSLAIGAAVTGAVGLAIGFVRALFTRNIGAAEKAQEEMRADVKNILLELRSMHDQQSNMRHDITTLTEKYATLKDAVAAEHARIDALVTMPPGKRK